MKTFEYTFGAGEQKEFRGGKYIILLSAPSAVDVEYYRNNSPMDENAIGVTSGYEWTAPDGETFDSVRITSSVAQTVKVGITYGKGGQNATAASLTGGIIDTVTNVGSVQQRNSIDGYHWIGAQNWQGVLGTDYIEYCIWNPAASGVVAYLHEFSIYSDTAGTNFYAGWAYSDPGWGAATLGNKNFIGASNGGVRFESVKLTASPVYPSTYFIYMMQQVGRNKLFNVPSAPLAIPAGYGLLCMMPAGVARNETAIIELEIR